ncbi:exported hypothetical protein [Vibrio nigripulchritudo MADA3029]|uniref:hypothetical protein n=1 Tax=Vibrio nigripulchritudo TaxID=28173 RepID=UPI0003B1918A|nr:hypothetical protein [Vibrio nigripulchritudo]CCN49928.1 exported hypothetical protein [Vibrio nigripulchritudo MADA3020]CCN56430.1 exported hypothetical protein [Vibrio nigripulchritudo MADA3021]CCN62077.1 exported hypothetical protein [Vibrio nigripulchritudo MADA3029]
MKACIIFILSTLFSFNVFSACSKIGCIGAGKDVLISVYPNSSGNIYLQAGVGREQLDCKLVEGHYMVLKATHPAFESVYSTVLTALASQKKLMVRIVNGSPNCEVSYVRMYM